MRSCDDDRVTTDRWSNLLALLAGVVGLTVIIRTWPRRPRPTQVARLRHPSTPPPVGVVLDQSGDGAHWRVVTSPASLPTTVDIVTWRAVGPGDDWRSEPIVEPVLLEPGGSAVLPLTVDDPTTPHLVVVAWTVRHPGGDVQGSRTLTIGATSSTVPAAVPADRGWTLLVASALVAALLVLLVLVAGWRVLDGDGVADRASVAPVDTVPPTTPMIPVMTIPATSSRTTPAPTTVSTTTVSTTTLSTTSVSDAPRSAGVPDDRSIDVRGRLDDCRFGVDCVIASFSAIGFPAEGDYVCEFSDGTRFTFRYAGGGALDACATSGESASITIEIDGVRSATLTRATLEAG